MLELKNVELNNVLGGYIYSGMSPEVVIEFNEDGLPVIVDDPRAGWYSHLIQA